MNFKKSWKRANDGFTLVELIVVIAILAILAGIAVPAYSGYIKKANKAADLQLLGAINTAFAAAALENGDDVNDLTSATAKMPIMTNGAINYSGIQPAEYQEAFAKYFDGNNGTFKVVTSLVFSNGAFGENEGGSGNMTGAQVQAAVDRYNKSNHVGNEGALVGNFESISAELANRINGGLNLEIFMQGSTAEEKSAAYNAFKDRYKLNDESSSTEIANALIMDTASKTQGVTAQDIVALAGDGFNNIAAVQSQYGDIATSAMMYGIISGYANSGLASESFTTAYAQTPGGLGDVTNLKDLMMSDPNFGSYAANTGDKGMVSDLDGYLAAMEVINGHDGSFDLTKSDAFTNDAAIDMLNSILGKK